ncbi:hypothetical protein HanRHA438_Chr11g0520471 [Helianthus annuus]|nr:hypothetical protein HanRHA438_Chr11g0520471 [Helianthus annuus]
MISATSIVFYLFPLPSKRERERERERERWCLYRSWAEVERKRRGGLGIEKKRGGVDLDILRYK